MIQNENFALETFAKQKLSGNGYKKIHEKVTEIVKEYCATTHPDATPDELERKTTNMYVTVVGGIIEILIQDSVAAGELTDEQSQKRMADAMLDTSLLTTFKSQEEIDKYFSREALEKARRQLLGP